MELDIGEKNPLFKKWYGVATCLPQYFISCMTIVVHIGYWMVWICYGTRATQRY